MKKSASFLKRMLPFILVMATIIVLLICFRISNFNTVSNGTWKLLEETTDRKKTLLSEKFQSYKTLVSSLAFAYRDDFALKDSDILSPLVEMEANTGFDYIRFIDKSGMSHTSKGTEADCSDRPYFIRGMKGETGVCDVQNSRLNGESMIGFFSPVENDGEYIGVLVGFISQRNLSFLLESEIFGLNVDAFVFTKSGTIVGSDNVSLLNNDIYESLGSIVSSSIKGYTYSNKRGVENIYEGKGEGDQAFISRIGNEDYFLLMHFPLSYIEEIAATIGSSGNNLFASLLLVFIFFSLYTIAFWIFSNKKNRRMRNLIVEGIVDNEDMVLLLNNEGGVEIIKNNRGFKVVNAEIGAILPLSSIISSFSSLLDHDPGSFISSFHNSIESAKKGKGDDIVFVDSFIFNGETNYLQFMLRGTHEGKEPVVVITVRLVTKVVEKEKEKLQEALEKAEAAAKAKSTFLANMSHDLRTPMNAIIGYTNLAQSNISDINKEKKYLERITDSSKQLLSLLNDVLDMSLIEGGKISLDESSCCLRDVFASIESLTETSVAAKGQMLHISVDNLLHENVFVDKVRLNQILLNCVTNAIKYTPEGGDIWLTLYEKSADKEKGIFVFKIKDNGIGMAKEFLEIIWEPFERERNTTVSKIQGTGLGMAITKNLVTLMNGNIEVESSIGEGSEFTITLALRLDVTKEGEVRTYSGRKALVVGNTKTVQSLPPLLERLSLSVSVASSYEDALKMAEGVDVLVLDMTIPRSSGLETIKELRKRIGEKALFIVTTYKLKDDEKLEDYGVDAYAPKPVFFSDLQKIFSLCPLPDHTLYVTRKEMDLRGKQVLLVEDNDLNREIAETVLTDMGMIVECAVNGQDAVEKVENATQDAFDIILMDIQMPVMDGYEATRRIRSLSDKKKASIPILSMTANAFPEDKIKALDAGMNGHVAKPFETTVLVSEMIEAILSNES
ncbi:MAG: response regulator [Spirochaetales bacterium]|nr:response regulator [Spirochaetales bacterium]